MRIVVAGASAGGVEALIRLVGGLPGDLDAAVLVTLHMPAGAPSRLPGILSRAGPLPAVPGTDGLRLAPDTIVIAPPGRHLLPVDGQVRLGSGPKVNRHRPSVDVMFAAAARTSGTGVVGVVLTGALDDGAVGAAMIDRSGGRVLVQDPREALFSSMPQAALAAVPGARALPVDRLGPAVAELVRTMPESPAVPASGEGRTDMTMAGSDDPFFLAGNESRLTRLTCPDCDGSLAAVDLGNVSYYRCHVGHQWSPRTLAEAQSEESESKLWAAIASLDEESALHGHLAAQPGGGSAAGHRLTAGQAAELAELLRDRLRRRP